MVDTVNAKDCFVFLIIGESKGLPDHGIHPSSSHRQYKYQAIVAWLLGSE
jgi:hypothetical protein